MNALESSQTPEETSQNESKKRKYDSSRKEDPTDPEKRLKTDEESAMAESQVKLIRGRYEYQTYGMLRTKPGRGDAETTTSMSCRFEWIDEWSGAASMLTENCVATR